jgi:hypothetical protein
MHDGNFSHRRPGTRRLQPGYAEIRAASALHPDSGAWAFFMREIIKLPLEMTPQVFWAIRRQEWTAAADPLATVRSRALGMAKRP